MGQWVQTTIESMKNKSALERHFSKEEEVVVEHLARIWSSIKGQLTPTRKFKGKIVYLTQDPFTEEN
jgi:CII-binding regulator of phage lambda lysogenization HflD